MIRVTRVFVVTLAVGVWMVGCSGGRGISGVNDNNDNTNGNTNDNTNDNTNVNVGCGNGVREVGEECDGGDLGGATCLSLGYSGGSLGCASDCTFDRSGCDIPDGCGNGLVDPGEDCDGVNLGGETCESQGYTGGTLACAQQCVFDPTGCTSDAVCGDGVVTVPEECDGVNLGGATCVSLGHLGGDLACDSLCAFDLSGCVDEICGNGVAEPAEDCDGIDLGGATCVSRGFPAGVLACGPSCSFDETGCVDHLCGNGVAEPTEDCDGVDLGAATCLDLGYVGGTLACGPSCSFDETGCVDHLCGNAIAEPTEDCDGNDLGGADCTSLGFLGGTLACDGACGFDTTGCTGACGAAAQANAQFGCDFWAADLPQYSMTGDYAISVQNPSTTDTATVTVATASGVTLATLTVPPLSRQEYTDTTRNLNVGGAGVVPNGIHITSDQPIAVAQFNAWDTSSASSDTSLVIPVHGLGTRYYAMDYTARADNDSYVAVVATQAQTTVSVYATAAVNGATTALLDAGDVMVVTAANLGTSLTGSRIEADLPVAVFSGNVCANVPTGVSYCDHLEEQIFPRRVLGTDYALDKSAPRTGCLLDDRVRVLADADFTTVTFDPPVVSPWSGNAGEWVEVAIAGPVRISSNHPVMVGQFLEGPGDSQCNNEGDPAFILHPPLAQLVRDVTVSVPGSFAADYLSVVGPLGVTLTIDGAVVTAVQTQVGTSAWYVSRLTVSDGYHHVLSSLPVSVTVYGIEGAPEPQYVSYGYPAGLVFDTINPVE